MIDDDIRNLYYGVTDVDTSKSLVLLFVSMRMLCPPAAVEAVLR